MEKLTIEQVNDILFRHQLWMHNPSDPKAKRADFSHCDLSHVLDTHRDIPEEVKTVFPGVNLSYAIFTGADLTGCNLLYSLCNYAYFYRANLTGANLAYTTLSDSILVQAKLVGANLTGAILTRADLANADLTGAEGLVKVMGVEPGNIYWKRFGAGLVNNKYRFRVGRNDLRRGEVFAADERLDCASPGFHFASRSWCALHFPERPLEARVRIPEDAQINEPWNTDGKASASAIEILQVFDVKTGEDVTEKYRQS